MHIRMDLQKAKEIFGQNLIKEFPHEGTEFLYYNEETENEIEEEKENENDENENKP